MPHLQQNRRSSYTNYKATEESKAVEKHDKKFFHTGQGIYSTVEMTLSTLKLKYAENKDTIEN